MASCALAVLLAACTWSPLSSSRDRAALTTLYEATNGDGWSNNRGWLSDEPLDEWYGVKTDWRGRVVKLFLERNQLSGSIPPEIGQLSQLTWLVLSGNQLSGSIPPEIGQLSQLTLLSLVDNQLSGSIPPEIGQLSNLGALYLQENQLSGCIPDTLRSVSGNDLDELGLPDC